MKAKKTTSETTSTRSELRTHGVGGHQETKPLEAVKIAADAHQESRLADEFTGDGQESNTQFAALPGTREVRENASGPSSDRGVNNFDKLPKSLPRSSVVLVWVQVDECISKTEGCKETLQGTMEK